MDKLFEDWRAYGKSILKEGSGDGTGGGTFSKTEVESFLGVMQELKEILMAEDSIEKYSSLSEKWNEISDVGGLVMTLKFAEISEHISDQIKNKSEMPVAKDEEDEEGQPWDESGMGDGDDSAEETEDAEDSPEDAVEMFGKEWRDKMRNKIKTRQSR